MISTLNSRQLAAALWVALLVGYLLWKPGLRQSLLNLVRVAANRQILLCVLLVTVYVWWEVTVLARLELWDASHVAKTWLWIFGVGLVSLWGVATAEDAPRFIKEAVAKNFKLSVLLSFLVNFYTFPFLVEFLLVPIIVLFAGVQAVSEVKSRREEEYKAVKKFANRVLVLAGLAAFVYAAYFVFTDLKSFAKIETLKKFLVPIELSLLFVPLIYFFAVLSTYERLLFRLRAFAKEEVIYDFVKWRIIWKCNIDLRRLRFWSRNLPGLNLSSTKALLESFEFMRSPGSAEPPNGFAGLDWGSAPAAYLKRFTDTDEEGLALFVPKEASYRLPIFGCAVAEECYHYQHNKLYGVSIFLDGREAFDEGRYELQTLYGPATFVNERGDLFRWKWAELKIEILLSFESRHSRTTVWVTNEAIDESSPNAGP